MECPGVRGEVAMLSSQVELCSVQCWVTFAKGQYIVYFRQIWDICPILWRRFPLVLVPYRRSEILTVSRYCCLLQHHKYRHTWL